MNLTAVHQLVAGFAAGDAISLEAVAIREACRALGYASDIFAPAESVTPDTRQTCARWRSCRPWPRRR